jgi:hypothetical protein
VRISWFDISEVKAFTASLVEDLARTQSGGVTRGDKPAQVARRIDKLLENAADFERGKRLNIYKKAQLLSHVRRGLAGKAWSSADIESIIQRLVMSRLTGGNDSTRAAKQ